MARQMAAGDEHPRGAPLTIWQEPPELLNGWSAWNSVGDPSSGVFRSADGRIWVHRPRQAPKLVFTLPPGYVVKAGPTPRELRIDLSPKIAMGGRPGRWWVRHGNSTLYHPHLLPCARWLWRSWKLGREKSR